MKELWNHIKIVVICGVAMILIVCAFTWLNRIKRDAKMDETWLVEAQVIKKSTTTRDDEKEGSEKVYLIDCEDQDGIVQTFEITDASLDGRFGGAEVFQQIKTGKAYRFKVGWRERGIMDQAGYYPSIYAAAILTDFPLKDSDEITGQSSTEAEETTESAKADTTEAEETVESGSTEQDEETDRTEAAEKETTSNASDDGTTSAGLEIGGIKIEVVEETTVDKKLQESIEEQAKSEASESFEAEKQSLEAEIASLKAQLEENPDE